MIHLIRVYHNDQIQPVHVEAFDRHDSVPRNTHSLDCRCIPTWTDYYHELAEKCHLGQKIHGEYLKYEFGWIDIFYVYPTNIK